jgi:hypothetical protein
VAHDPNVNGGSSAHSNVAFAAFVVKVNVAPVSFVGFAGFVPMVGVAGAATVHAYTASLLVFPPFEARTRKVWLASDSAE